MGFLDFLFGSNQANEKKYDKVQAIPPGSKMELSEDAELKRIEAAKANNRRVIGELKEILIKEYLDYMRQYREYLISEAYMKQLVMGVMMREKELKKEADNNDMTYEEIDYEKVLEKLDEKQDEPEWKGYTPEKEAKRAELWEKRRVLYEELKGITDRYTMHLVDLEHTEYLLKEWKKEVKILIEAYELEDLPYKPIFDYWAKNKHKVNDYDEDEI